MLKGLKGKIMGGKKTKNNLPTNLLSRAIGIDMRSVCGRKQTFTHTSPSWGKYQKNGTRNNMHKLINKLVGKHDVKANLQQALALAKVSLLVDHLPMRSTL
jgi:hypothetical protein